MAHHIEKQAEHLIIQQRDREVTKQIRYLLNQKQKKINNVQAERKWIKFWKKIAIHVNKWLRIEKKHMNK
ncbi:hypothetical protein [Bacillus sp. Marseille-P3661]|uniref:hypothetical protein n=1 Tax=Bacillus sp. Marseille-P3661 TaxID=1936234 RepID=UPI000C81FE85|nr:hypothetical protein [Bacillus sp. Marseille-P3661]